MISALSQSSFTSTFLEMKSALTCMKTQILSLKHVKCCVSAAITLSSLTQSSVAAQSSSFLDVMAQRSVKFEHYDLQVIYFCNHNQVFNYFSLFCFAVFYS